ncbi:hypothetical protein C8R47DRAFT_1071997 [Mycena vitilis]|nr:hypothetical protein C8R47DRAFT_1071997 [Mycena vitilis]
MSAVQDDSMVEDENPVSGQRDSDNDSDVEMAEAIADGSRTISDIDLDYEQDGQCDICKVPLGPHVDEKARAFRCCNCELSIQCEACCSKMHEWDADKRCWGEPICLGISRLMWTLPKFCNNCDVVLGAPHKALPEGTFLCEWCENGPMLLCDTCTRKRHERKPLHFLKVTRN